MMKVQRKRSKGPSNASVRDGLAGEAKAIVAIAFRNGPIEQIHAGGPCSVCWGKSEYSHITQEQMKLLMKTAVDRVFTLLVLREEKRSVYKALVKFAAGSFAGSWDDPVFTSNL